MRLEVYNQIKEKYGKAGSWAVWDFKEDGEFRYDLNGRGYLLNNVVKRFNNVKSQADLDKLELHNKAVLVALNFGQREETIEEFIGVNEKLKDVDFHCFHEEFDRKGNVKGYSGDRRQKYGYQDTILWGAYMTDLIKFQEDGTLAPVADSKSNSDYLKTLLNNKDFMEIQINGLIDELKLLGCKDPIIAAVGGISYSKLNSKTYKDKLIEEFGPNTKIVRVPHYSNTNTQIDDNDYTSYRELIKKALAE
ncbi:hypothetical protein [Amphibacillus xylanus]|uniref:Uracil DNA glycosylase superfamily protein n=1 Tax=Amphibacillus xylanus (strain ATCC 51415 / DSM 6626 / JCM 7361 / LMG 17667 / NBRC 15112 / Ep01) TaxID=698758 RepID=K0IWI0_AMPXN|nr:hypothetical protein [Amphibacillus xylanus]BAM46694.1 hypothetical protein AXY_05620 [Amphibacillus xylanus NBRC 15112]